MNHHFFITISENMSFDFFSEKASFAANPRCVSSVVGSWLVPEPSPGSQALLAQSSKSDSPRSQWGAQESLSVTGEG